jgi:Helicase associated domain
MFAELKRYKERFGDCNVPRRWKENPQLATWVDRRRHRQRSLPEEKKARLDELGFEWDPRTLVWETRFAELRLYKERFGDCNVPPSWTENPKLNDWVAFQRARRKVGKLSSARKARLDGLGFEWGSSRR